MSDERVIKSDKWIRLAQDNNDGTLYITQSDGLLFHEAIGMLHDTLLRYETKFRLDMEYQDMGKIKDMVEELKLTMGTLTSLSSMVETSVIKMSAMAQTINRGSDSNGEGSSK